MSTTGKAIAILGAKGGVGTTTIAANLAAELAANSAESVLLVDLNLFLGDVGLQVGLEGEPTVMQWILDPGDAPAIEQIQKHGAGFWVLGLSADLSDADLGNAYLCSVDDECGTNNSSLIGDFAESSDKCWYA